MKGFAKESGEMVAIKTIDTTMLSDHELQLISTELKVMKAISHPSIVAHMGSFREGTQLLVVQELMEGGDLQQRISEVGHFHENQARIYVMDIAEALYYLHRHRIAHRDIKLENILLSCDTHGTQATAKLSDFGFAKRLDHADDSFFKTLCGTVSYMAPEIIMGNKYDLKVDIWSLGVVTYSLLAGYLPFRGTQSSEPESKDFSLEDMILESSVTFNPEYWTEMSTQAKLLISSMLQKDPTKRLSMSQVLEHRWFSMDISNEESSKHQVFFMIGSQ